MLQVRIIGEAEATYEKTDAPAAVKVWATDPETARNLRESEWSDI